MPQKKDTEIAAAMGEIYASSLSSFVKARDQVARRLRDEGDSEHATTVGKAKKPTLPAWTLTKLALTQPELLEKVEEADDRLSEAMTKGKAPDEVRKLTHDRHQTIGQVVDAGAMILEEEGHKAGPGVREKMAQTLYALSGDDEARSLLRSGLLNKELAPSGFGGLTELVEVPDKGADVARARRRVSKLAEEAKTAESRARDAEKKAEELEQELEALKRDVERARKNAERILAAAQEKKEEAEAAARALAGDDPG
jgi:hypothetical protein